MLLELTAGNLALRETMKAIRGRPQAVLMVEFSGDDETEVADRVEKLRRRLEGVNGLTASVPALDPSHARSALGPAQGRDAAAVRHARRSQAGDVRGRLVPWRPSALPEFVARFRETLQRHGTDGAFYGHASVGCLHIRPLLNLKDPDDVARMRRITDGRDGPRTGV